MFYLVSFDGIGTKADSWIQENDNCFIINATNDEELANAIGELVYSSGWGMEEIQHIKFFVYELDNAFQFKIAVQQFSGKRV